MKKMIKVFCNDIPVPGIRLSSTNGITEHSNFLGEIRLSEKSEKNLHVIDRDGKKIHPIKDGNINEIHLSQNELSGHFSRPITVVESNREKSNYITARTALGASLGGRTDLRERLDELCIPWLDGVPGFLNDAFDILSNRPAALHRFRDSMIELEAFVTANNQFMSGEQLGGSSISGTNLRSNQSIFPSIWHVIRQFLRVIFSIFSGREGSAPTIDPDVKEHREIATVPVDETIAVVHAALHARPAHWTTDRAASLAIEVLKGNYRYNSILSDFAAGNLTPLRAEQHLFWLDSNCGRDGRPLIPIPRPDAEDPPPRDDPQNVGIGCAVDVQSVIEALQTTYQITSIAPTNACAGETLIIRGTGFGVESGLVLIGGQRIGATFWSDTEVRVLLPADVQPGDVALDIRAGTAMVCDRLLEISSRQSPPAPYFAGGRPEVTIAVDPEQAEPGDTVTVSWATTASGPVTLVLPSAAGTSVPNIGSQTFTVPSTINASQSLTFDATAANRCGSATARASLFVHRPAQAWIDGIEVTQGIQFFDAGQPNHLIGTPSATRVDNALRLIPGKQTMARVYLMSNQVPNFNAGQVANVQVVLHALVDGEEGAQMVGQQTVSVQDQTSLGTVEARRNSAIASANFALPDNLVSSSNPFRLRATTTLPSNSPDSLDGARREFESSAFTFRFQSNIRLVLVRVNLTAHGIGAPTFGTPAQRAALFQQLNNIRTRLPTADFDLMLPETSDQVLNFGSTLNQTNTNTGCDDAWPELLDALEDLAKDYDGDEGAVWCGLLSAIPPGPGNTVGCGNTSRHARGVAAFAISNPTAAAHEIGHTFGIDHINQDNPDGNAFPNYGYTTPAPTLNTVQTNGEYGVDVELFNRAGTLNTFSPIATQDWMNSVIGATNWTSPYIWERLQTAGFAGGGGFGAVKVDGGEGPPQDFLHVYGRVNTATNEIRLRRLYHLPRRAVGQGRKYDSKYQIVLLDGDSNIVIRHPIKVRSIQRDGIVRISELVPFNERVKELQVRTLDDGIIFHRIRAAELPKILELKHSINKKKIELEWQTSGRLLYGVAGSRDGGHTWWAIRKGIRAQKLSLQASELSGGAVKFRLIATDGFNTVYADTDEIDLGSTRTHYARIEGIPADHKVAANTKLTLRAQLLLNGLFNRENQEKALAWKLNDELLDNGVSVDILIPQGKHTISLEQNGTPFDSAKIIGE